MAATSGQLPRPGPRHRQLRLPGRASTAWWVVERVHADLDGDGSSDTVRVREPDRLSGYEVVVALAERTVVLPERHGHSFDFEPVDQADVDGQPGEELFVLHEVPVRTFTAMRWTGDDFAAIPAPRGERLTDDLAPDLLAKAWWLEGDQVVTYESVAPCAADAAAETVSCPDRMSVRASAWRVVDGVWRIRPLGRHCVSSAEPHRLLPPCPGGGVG